MDKAQDTAPGAWQLDRPFGQVLTDDEVERALTATKLADIDLSRFPPARALHAIVRDHARLKRYRRGEIVVRKGDYGNSLFFILRGSVHVVIGDFSGRKSGPSGAGLKRGVGASLNALYRLPRNPGEIEVRDVDDYRASGARLRGEDRETLGFVDDLDALRGVHATVHLGERKDEALFGEIGALLRGARNATVIADTDDTELLELRWQGLREIRRYDEDFRDWIDGLCRARSLPTYLVESPLFAELDAETLQQVAGQTRLEQYGSVEWNRKVNAAGDDRSRSTSPESLIVGQGDHIDSLLLICSGFARVTGEHEHTLQCLKAHNVYGLEEIWGHLRDGTELTWRHSLYAIGCIDILAIPVKVIEQVLLSSPQAFAAAAGSAIDQTALNREGPIDQPLLDFLVDGNIVNGRSTMLIDNNRCTGCDDCVRACAAGHDNNPRFRRHGPVHANLMVANACMHCSDAVCLPDCPTGAIHQEPDGQVRITDATCIGCGACAQSCPYDNISLVSVRDRDGNYIVDETNRPVIKATNCDLCFELPGGPACQRACPHDALIRVDTNDHAALNRWMNRG